MPRILYIHQFFKHPGQAGITRSYYLALALANAGFDVDVISSTNIKNEPLLTLHPRLHVHYVHVPYSNEMGIAARFRAFLMYVVKALWLQRRLPKICQVFCTSTPLSVVLIALHLKFWKKIPYIFETRDLWPDFPIAMGAGGPAPVRALFYALVRYAYLFADEVVALSPGIAAGVLRRVPKAGVTLIPNFSDLTLFSPTGPKRELPGLQSHEFGVVYFGALGKANGLDSLLNASRAAQNENLPLRFFVFGEGSERIRLQQKATGMGLQNLTFMGIVPKNELPAYLRSATFSYVSFLPLPVLETTSPNKFFDSLAMGLIICVNMNGWLRDVLERSKAGFYAGFEQGAAFVQAIKPYLENEHVRSHAQQAALGLAKNRFNNTIAGERLVALMKRYVPKP